MATYPNFNFTRLLGVHLAAAFAFCVVLALPVSAQQNRGAIDEVTVTGSYIPHTPEDAPVPVEVVDSEELFNLGNPSVVELVKTLGISSGVDGETNQFQSNGLEGTANINLRGLGAGRNLVLLNGRRNVWSPYPIAEQQQLFVDINMIPAVAIDRVEMLKDGAAATYGSDAISGVVNFITRSDFEGMEFALSHKEIDGSQGDQDFGFIWGHDFGNTHVMAALGLSVRNELKALDRDWAIQPYLNRGNGRGYTGIPNPGTFFPLTNSGGPSLGGFITDPRCQDFIGNTSFATRDKASAVAKCTYSYVFFDNLIEKEERSNFFAEVTHEFDADMTFNLELLFAESEVPEWKSSPSYPPQTLFDTRRDTGRFIPAYHPGLVHMASLYGDLFGTYADKDCAVNGRTDTSCDKLMFFGRPFGISGPSEVGHREHETMRLAAALEGTTGNDINYDLSVLWTQAEGQRVTVDTIAEHWSLALRGFGGPNCAANATVPGKNGCLFYNPFSNSIQYPQSKFARISVNPDYNPQVANSAELRDWMTEGVGSDVESTLLVMDAVLSGESNFANMDIGWAFGLQNRREEYVSKPFKGADLTINPCQTEGENQRWREAGSKAATKCDAGTTGDTSDDYEGSGRYIFLAGATPFDDEQDINALFAELAVPVTDALEFQLSARYEDYGGNVGDSFDPKVAFRWLVSDAVTVRGSASTTFRGPTLNQLGGRSTTLSFVAPTGTFKAVDTFGNANLKPESANTANLGVLFTSEDWLSANDEFSFSIDYWSFDFEDPVIKESFNQLIAATFTVDHDNDPKTAAHINPNSPYASRFTLASGDPTASRIQRIRVNMINGPDIETTGFDMAIGYSMDAMDGRMSFNAQLTQIDSFDVGKSATGPGFDALGKLNDTVDYLRPIVETKAKLSATYERDDSTINLVANYTGDYRDAGTDKRQIGEHSTYDVHYNLGLGGFNEAMENSAFWLSVYNITDEDPPYARLDLNYDPYTHNPFGRMVKLGIRHSF
jgi:iron complex outermembrane receptor protein